MLAMTQKDRENSKGFHLDADYDDHSDFQLESPVPASDADNSDLKQTEFFLPERNSEKPETEDQLELKGLE